MNLFEMQAISVEKLLGYGEFPFADVPPCKVSKAKENNWSRGTCRPASLPNLYSRLSKERIRMLHNKQSENLGNTIYLKIIDYICS